MSVRWLYPMKNLQHTAQVLKAGGPKCPVLSVSTYSRCIVVLCYIHVLQFLYTEWQQFLSVSFFYLSLSSSPRLDPSFDRCILHIGTQTNLLAYDIKDTRDILYKKVCFIHFLIFQHLHVHVHVHCRTYTITPAYTCTFIPECPLSNSTVPVSVLPSCVSGSVSSYLGLQYE